MYGSHGCYHKNLIIRQMVCDNLELGLGLRQTTHEFNKFRLEQQLPQVSVSAVHGLVHKLKPKMRTITPMMQGIWDKTTAWARARLGFTLQLGIRLDVFN